MNIQNNIIAFCYWFIAGLIAAMLWPVGAFQAPWLTALAVGSFLPLIALLLAMMLKGVSPRTIPRGLLWVLIALPALLLGYARYNAANQVHDDYLGRLSVSEEGALSLEQQLSETARMRFALVESPGQDLAFRLIGELEVRTTVLDDQGLPTLAEGGLWEFHAQTMIYTSDVVRFEADAPAGTGQTLDQPFSRILGIQLLEGDPSGKLDVYQIANHTRSFVRGRRMQSPVTVLGRISQDPRVYSFKTVIMVKPAFIQYPAGGTFFPVHGGEIQVTINPDMPGYEKLARTDANGADVMVSGELTFARGPSNPGGFDAARFLQNYNIFGTMFLYSPRGSDPLPIAMIGTKEGEVRQAMPLVRFSLGLRDQVLTVIKQTMPYPQSAFLGGVILGLRYGLQGVEWDADQSGDSEEDSGRPMSTTIVQDFKASGVNHVLAVSGLHVTILTVMFLAIFTLFKLPRQVFVPLVILALIVFAVITGARPSTLRAVIMNSLFLLTWAYLNQGLRSSILFGVPVAAFLILIHNPLVVVDPSLTLSFGAILSLALLTGPFHEKLLHLQGSVFVAAVTFAVVLSVVATANWFLITSWRFLLPLGVLMVLLFRWMAPWSGTEKDPFARLRFSGIPSTVGAFLAAQLAIQIGMMIPLSAFYFSRWPFAGAYANLIAIPLIGLVVQLGAIGGLLGLIPGVGPFIALILNAANWLGATLFVDVAHFFAKYFPYPFVHRPSLGELFFYYAVASAWVWAPRWYPGLKTWCATRGATSPWAPRAVSAGLIVLSGLPFLLEGNHARGKNEAMIEVLSIGFGSSIHVHAPDDGHLLLDVGYSQQDLARRIDAEWTVLPYLSHIGVRHLDGLVLTGTAAERVAGTSYLLDHLRCDHLWMPDGLARMMAREVASPYLQGDGEEAGIVYQRLMRPILPGVRPLPTVLAARAPSAQTWLAHSAVKPSIYRAGEVLYDSAVGEPFQVVMLKVGDPYVDAAGDVHQGSVLRIDHGSFRMLVISDIDLDLLSGVSDRELKADILVLPRRTLLDPGYVRGDRRVQTMESQVRSLLQRVQPEQVILEYAYPRAVMGGATRDVTQRFQVLDRLFRRQPDIRFYVTERTGSIRIHTTGDSYRVETMAERNRSRYSGDADNTVSSISVGF
ncbi:MAG: ComEC/Rec2 family competence protein [Verrucomicrobia bacterium]|nr:ComEC/Rec2 family competence protein [Verrucomicrobiota bacterium]